MSDREPGSEQPFDQLVEAAQMVALSEHRGPNDPDVENTYMYDFDTGEEFALLALTRATIANAEAARRQADAMERQALASERIAKALDRLVPQAGPGPLSEIRVALNAISSRLGGEAL